VTGGIGIMADDLLAGLLGLVILQVFAKVVPL
jgi:phosphatidylglycerophosphatase A